MGNVAKHILDPGARLYGAFDTDDADMVMDLYERALSHLSDRALEGAFVIVSREYMPSKRMPWPAPSIFAKAAERVADNDKPAGDGDRSLWQKPLADDLAHARAYMRACNSSLIEMALRDGWGRSLQDVARDVIRQSRERQGQRPTMEQLRSFRMSQADVDYYTKRGQPFVSAEHDDILSARQQLGFSPIARGKMHAAGDAA
jgi:hypothetical protein